MTGPATRPPEQRLRAGGVRVVHRHLWPTFADAAARRVVQLPDGRFARLVWVRNGQANVRLPSGAYLRRSVCDLAVQPVDDTPVTP